ncbi:MAG: VTT domain-containing protein [Chloroflexi bacterium]|nr:VTT domain-containing protein [Chloroflexota bacterium]
MTPPGSTGEHTAALPRRDRWVHLAEQYAIWVRAATLALVLAVVILGIVLWVMGRLGTDSIGYPSIWVISFIGASSVFLPVPGMLALCIGVSSAVGLNPILVGLTVASAETLGEMTGYLGGVSGAGLLERNRWYTRFKWWLNRKGGTALFILATVPNPIFDLLGIAAGAARYPVHKFLAIVFVGKSIKSIGIAYACYLGVSEITELIEWSPF